MRSPTGLGRLWRRIFLGVAPRRNGEDSIEVVDLEGQLGERSRAPSAADDAAHVCTESPNYERAATTSSTGRFLDKLADLILDGGGESVHGKRSRPKVTVIEVCVLLETERCVP